MGTQKNARDYVQVGQIKRGRAVGGSLLDRRGTNGLSQYITLDSRFPDGIIDGVYAYTYAYAF
jgi:hypothetical protein